MGGKLLEVAKRIAKAEISSGDDIRRACKTLTGLTDEEFDQAYLTSIPLVVFKMLKQRGYPISTAECVEESIKLEEYLMSAWGKYVDRSDNL